MDVVPLILDSARKHGISDEDMLHAFRNPIDAFQLDNDLVMLVGPSRTAVLLEVGIVGGAPRVVIVHAMRVRQRYLR